MTYPLARSNAPVESPRSLIDEENPWPGLAAFDEAGQRFFNGRRSEAAELRGLVLHAPLTVVFGASGLGKTSLIQAGLFPLLRRDNVLPVYVRLDVRDRTAPLIDQVKHATLAQFRLQRVDAPAFADAESLWEWLHRDALEVWSQGNRLLTPVFVLDQFEEVFTLGAGNAGAIARLRIDLADLIENRLPAGLAERLRAGETADSDLSLDSQRYRILVSFREDFLPAVEGWKRDLPSIMRNRLRLLPMSGEQAFAAVHETAPHLADEAIARDIVRFVAAAQEERPDRAGRPEGENDLAVEPALLSLVCRGLNERRKLAGRARFDAALLRDTGFEIVHDYYRNAVGDLPERVQTFIERELITERGFRKPGDADEAREVYGVTERELGLLVDRRLLRIEPQRGTERVELIHDLLTGVVRELRDHRRESDRVWLRKKRYAARLAALTIVAGLAIAGAYGVQQRREFAAVSARNEALQQQLSLVRDLVARLEAGRHDAGPVPAGASEEPAPDALEAIEFVQRSLENIEVDRIAAIVREMNDPSSQVRRSAVARLERSDRVNPVAIDLVLETLRDRNLDALSASGRINALYFLNASDPRAWTGEHRRLAREAIQRIRLRSDAGIARIGRQTGAELDRLEAKIGT